MRDGVWDGDALPLQPPRAKRGSPVAVDSGLLPVLLQHTSSREAGGYAKPR